MVGISLSVSLSDDQFDKYRLDKKSYNKVAVDALKSKLSSVGSGSSLNPDLIEGNNINDVEQI